MKYFIAGLLLAAAGAPAQEKPPSFEVASIKPNNSGDHRVAFGIQPGGRIAATNVTVKMLIQEAYNIKGFQISGGPSWIESDHFDISAKPEAPANQEQLRLMMQALLADRFHLVMRRERREMPVYALVVAKSGPKFRANESDPNVVTPGGRGGRPMGMMRVGRGQLTAQGADMALFATQLSNAVGRGVIDKTGLAGRYDLKLEWTQEEGQEGSAPSDLSGPSLFTALQEQLGLRLDPEKGPVEVFVIERLEKPSEN